jgi:hypothetical protein
VCVKRIKRVKRGKTSIFFLSIISNIVYIELGPNGERNTLCTTISCLSFPLFDQNRGQFPWRRSFLLFLLHIHKQQVSQINALHPFSRLFLLLLGLCVKKAQLAAASSSFSSTEMGRINRCQWSRKQQSDSKSKTSLYLSLSLSLSLLFSISSLRPAARCRWNFVTRCRYFFLLF